MPRKRKSTLRTLPETAREIAKLAGEAHSLSRKLMNIASKVQTLEMEAQAGRNYETKLKRSAIGGDDFTP